MTIFRFCFSAQNNSVKCLFCSGSWFCSLFFFWLGSAPGCSTWPCCTRCSSWTRSRWSGVRRTWSSACTRWNDLQVKHYNKQNHNQTRHVFFCLFQVKWLTNKNILKHYHHVFLWLYHLLHKRLCRQTWNRSHREILIGKEREPLCDVAKLNRISWLPKKLLNL